jgi:hypothetical protein
MIKITFIFVVFFFIALTGFAQDTVRIETIRVDTVKVETVRVDTVLVVPVNSAAAVHNTTAQTALQQEQKPFLNPNKMYFGGYVNLSFGSYTVVGIEPLVGYKLTPKFSVGTKLSYEYTSYSSSGQEYSGSNYGLSFFTRHRITSRFYAHAEYSAMNYKLFYGLDDSDREWVSFLFLGGGFSQPISKNTWFTAEVLFDVLQNDNSPYAAWEPFFSVGFGVGF